MEDVLRLKTVTDLENSVSLRVRVRTISLALNYTSAEWFGNQRTCPLVRGIGGEPHWLL